VVAVTSRSVELGSGGGGGLVWLNVELEVMFTLYDAPPGGGEDGSCDKRRADA
jgi:hypothetical protein